MILWVNLDGEGGVSIGGGGIREVFYYCVIRIAVIYLK